MPIPGRYAWNIHAGIMRAHNACMMLAYNACKVQAPCLYNPGNMPVITRHITCRLQAGMPEISGEDAWNFRARVTHHLKCWEKIMEFYMIFAQMGGSYHDTSNAWGQSKACWREQHKGSKCKNIIAAIAAIYWSCNNIIAAVMLQIYWMCSN